MSFLRYLIFFSIFHSLIINPADSNCPKSFECGPDFGALEFPFTNRKDCGGLFMVENCNTAGYPFMQFGGGVTWYNILRIQASNNLVILDLSLNQYKKTKSCTLSLRNVSLPDHSPSTTFKLISPLNLTTVFTCQNQSPQEAEYFENYSHVYCPPWDVYYRNPETSHNIPLRPHHIPSECSVSHVPMKPSSNQNSSSGDFFDLLIDEYMVEWNVTEECNACHKHGGECRTNSVNAFHCYRGNRKFKNTLLIGGVAMAALTFTVIIFFLSVRKNYKLLKLLGILKKETGKELDIELFLKDHRELGPKRYKYSDLKKMTKSFGENLGKGGYGSVYKGRLPDGRLVAVKILNESKGNGEEFINEVASISRTSHINVVTLLGFCFEDSKRALIYDFMPNGSLEKYIQNNVSEEDGGLGREKLFEIALCVARGLAYLHEGCITRILHFDIKPQNILLDMDFNPKISDFGLAKLCPNRSNIVSMMVARGTIGYIAPEVFCSNFGEVSYKSDVYSYGMMVLEIAGEKKRIDRGDVDRTSETYFPQYIYKQLELMDGTRLDDHEIVHEGASDLAKRKLIVVGLWCIQTDPKDRPPMSKVVEMLEGKIESLQVPPKPYLSSPPRFELNFSTNDSTSQSTL